MDFNYYNEKYEKLYDEFKKVFESMVFENNMIENKPMVELMYIAKLKYPEKERAITRVGSLFAQDQTIENLNELLELYKFIKE